MNSYHPHGHPHGHHATSHGPHAYDAYLLGHSFSSGFLQHLEHRYNVHGSVSVSNLLNLDQILPRFHIYGIRGGRATHFTLPDHFIKVKPQIVILDLGSNDIAAGTPPLDVATSIIDLATHLINSLEVKQVTICSIIPRFERVKEGVNFADEMYNCNKYLQNLAEVEERVRYHVHKGFWAVDHREWSRDGIHPNQPQGRGKYRASLRSAVFNAIADIS